MGVIFKYETPRIDQKTLTGHSLMLHSSYCTGSENC